MTRINEITCRSILNRSGIPGVDYGINPYVGCMHKCQYCYAVFMKKFTGHTEPWGDFVDVKINAPSVLERQLKKLKKKSDILFGTVCDAYQPLEKRYRITRQCLEKLIGHPHAVSILTKSPLVLEDLDLLRKLRDVEVGFTIVTLDEKVRRVFEPGTLPPERRFHTINVMSCNNIPTWIFVAPVLPYFSDQTAMLRKLMIKARNAGTRYILFDTLNPYPRVWRNVTRLVKKHFPRALPSFREYEKDADRYGAALMKKISAIGLEERVSCKFAFGCGG
ncbi:MAG: radical SAM protein [candidate division WOR-3 bacterium]|nr:MAG: radical SAM protein [candidate division WOR-3 bacterium]